MSANNLSVDKRDGTNTEHGSKFEQDLTCLTYVRCLKLCKLENKKLKAFQIFSNIKYVGAFDDVICRIVYEDNDSFRTKLIFVQAKHKENPNKNVFSDETLMRAMKLEKKGIMNIELKKRKKDKVRDNPIYKYIISYLQIRKIFVEEEIIEKFMSKDDLLEARLIASKTGRKHLREIFDCNLEDTHLLYYTNATSGSIEFFEQIKDINIVTNIFDTSSNNGIYKLKLENTNLGGIMAENFEDITEEEIDRVNNFEDKFFVYINQEKERSLEEDIKSDIKCLLNISNVDVESVYAKLLEEIKQHFKSNQTPILTEEMNFVNGVHILSELQFQAKKIKEKYTEFSKLFNDEFVEKSYEDAKNNFGFNNPTCKLTKTETIVAYIQVEEKICKENNNALFLYIENNDTFNTWKNVRTLYSYKKYSEIVVCVDNVPTNDIEQIWRNEEDKHELIITLPENNIESDPSLWNQLSSMGKEKILNYDKMSFQGSPAKLKEIVGNNVCQGLMKELIEILMTRVLNNERIDIGNDLSIENDIYIERKYKKCTSLSFEAIISNEDIFIIFPKPDDSNSWNLDKHENVFSFKCEAEAKENFFSRKKYNQNLHLCLVKVSHLEVLLTKGTLKNILKYETDLENTNEEVLQHSMNNKFTIIADDVGMGKTTALKRLTHCMKMERKEYWIEYVELRSQDEVLKYITVEINSTEAAELVATQILKLDVAEKIIFKHKCGIDGNVALFFDGFDEISTEYKDHFVHLISALSATKIKSFVLSTRTNFVEDLKICLQTLHFKFVGFNFEDMYSYLLKFWSKMTDKKYSEKLKDLLNKIVNDVIKIQHLLKDIVAVPLETHMIAETYKDQIVKILSSEDSLTSFKLPSLNIFSLYNNFFDMHMDRCLEEKFETTKHNKNNFEFCKKMFFKAESGIWEAIACRELFPSIKICELAASDLDELVKQRIGIFLNTDPVTFMHRSFAEFQAAKYISKKMYESNNVEHLNFIYQRVFVGPSFAMVRKFINACYENERHWETADVKHVPELDVDDCVLMCAVEENNAFLFKCILRHLSRHIHIIKRIMNHKHDGKRTFQITGQSLLHISAKYCEELFDDILNSEYFHSMADKDNGFRTALHYACENGREIAVKSYLKKFQNEPLREMVNKSDGLGYSALMWAAESGHCNVVRILHTHGANLNVDSGMNSALLLASTENHIDIVKFLLEQGVDVNQTNYLKETALIKACENGREEIVRYLVETSGADVNQTNYKGETALIMACKNGRVDIIRYLVETAGADVNKEDDFGISNLMYLAESSKNIDTIKFLIHHGAKIKVVNSQGRSAFIVAAKHGQIEILEYLIELGVGMDAVDSKGRTAYMLASISGNIETLKYLIKLGYNFANKVDADGNTCLILASNIKGNTLKLQYLIEMESNINHQNHDGDTALITAVLYDCVDNVELLIDHGANVNICNQKGDSAIIVCSRYERYNEERKRVMKYLLEKGAEINQRNHEGNSALHYAANKHNVEMVKILVENGAEINLENNDGITPVMIAKENEDRNDEDDENVEEVKDDEEEHEER